MPGTIELTLQVSHYSRIPQPGTALRVPEVGPLATEANWNGAKGAGGWTLGDEIDQERRYGC